MSGNDLNTSEIDALLARYPLVPGPVQDNERRAWVGTLEGHPVRLADYGTWCNVTVAFGSVRTLQGTPMGEAGIGSAALYLSNTGWARDVPNFDLPAPKWRVALAAPKGRTVCPGPDGRSDGFVVTQDIVAHLLACRDSCAAAATHPHDLFFGAWERATPGWIDPAP
jgi:hypothetical protein